MLQETIKNRTIFCKDNLDILQNINSNTIDLIYLDPPFNKKKVFTAPIGSSAEGASFKDYFREEDLKDEWLQTIKEDHIELYNFLNGIKNISSNKHYLYNYCYLAYMAIRLIEMHRILKDTGSLYFHCDPTMSHYIKLLMDIIFGEKNFRNEITWKRVYSNQKGSQHRPKQWGSNTDIIFFYVKSENANLDPYKKLTEEEIFKLFPHIEKDGRRYNITSSDWFSRPTMGPRPNLCYTYKGVTNPHPSGWRVSKEKLIELDKNGYVIWRKNKRPLRKLYADEYKGYVYGNIWIDIKPVIGNQRIGYPTQKPLALLERIIKASSNKNDVVLDPFCGCATTCVAAEKLKRQWIGIDVSVTAYELVKKRLAKEIKGEEENGQRDLLNYEKEVYYTTTSPNRTDIQEKNHLTKKYVYVISNPAFVNMYKVGIASNCQARLNSYQTSDPNRGYHLQYKKHTHLFRSIEKHIHTTFDNQHEWVRGQLEDIIQAIEKYRN